MGKAILAGIVTLCVTVATASAATRNVPSEYARIQEAIEACDDGDTVVVAPGVYFETINFGGRNIVVTSKDPNDPKIVGYTVINADGDGTTVTFENGETPAAVLTGFTITGGFGTLDTTLGAPYRLFWGAGIYCNGASPTITRNIIANNESVVEITGQDVADIKLSYGGGIGCLESNAVITNNILKGNRAYAGGGVMTYLGNAKVAGNLIFDNSATIGAGVVLIQGELVNNTIVANNTGAGGQEGPGGNVYVVFDPALGNYRIWNNIICNATSGGGLCWEGAPSGDAIVFNDVWNNLPGDYGTIDPMSPAQTMYDGAVSMTGTAGNVSVDPLFVDSANKNYHLTLESPCINAGDPDRVVAPGEKDFDGNGRVYAFRIDMGADEYVGYVKPVAFAGPDQHLLFPLLVVTLDGRQSYIYDPCSAVAYRWAQVSGPAAMLDDPNSATPAFTPVANGEYVFQLVVNDGQYSSVPDQVLVLVAENRAPVANAGPDRAWNTSGQVALDGTGSYDPDAVDRLSYQWVQVEGTPVDLQDANTAAPSFAAGAEGRYVFELVVNDRFADSEPSRVQCVAVGVTMATRSLDMDPQDALFMFYPDVSGSNAVFVVSDFLSIYEGQVAWVDLQTGQMQTFEPSGINIHPKIDGDLVVWANAGTFTGDTGPECTSVIVRNIATGDQQVLRARSNTSSFGHPAVSGNNVVWVQHVRIDKDVTENWANTPYDICGADLTDFDKPAYFTIAASAGRRDPFPYRNPASDFDDVVDLCGNLVVWEGNGDIYAADISDLNHIRVVTVCDHPARQHEPVISGRYVVWTDERNDRGDIYGADLSDLENIRELEIVKAPAIQQQPTIDGSLVAYMDGSVSSGLIRLVCLTYNHGVLSVDLADRPMGMTPVLDGNALAWLTSAYGFIEGLTLEFGYSVFDGRVQNLRTGKRYDYVQHAVVDANDGDQVVAKEDRYVEKIGFAGKAVTVRSMDPNDPAIVAATVLSGRGNVVSFVRGEKAASVLAGLTISGGNQGVVCYSTSPTIRQCAITGNLQAGVRLLGQSNPAITRCQIIANGAAGIEMSGPSTGGRAVRQNEATISNCIIAGNRGEGVHGGKPTVVNCTVVQNQGQGINGSTPTVVNSIVYFNNQDGVQIGGTRPVVSYSDVQGGWSGEGNLDADPLFVALGRWTDPTSSTGQMPARDGRTVWVVGDYHLKSAGWRWDMRQGSWVSDEVTSPCIDAGDPASGLFNEPLTGPGDTTDKVINTRIDMGAYGGTPEASLAPVKQ